MTSVAYRYVQRLNLLRQVYFGDFGSVDCDSLDVPSTGFEDVLAFSRGCSPERRVAVVANFHAAQSRNVSVSVLWPVGTVLVDVLPEEPYVKAMCTSMSCASAYLNFHVYVHRCICVDSCIPRSRALFPPARI